MYQSRTGFALLLGMLLLLWIPSQAQEATPEVDQTPEVTGEITHQVTPATQIPTVTSITETIPPIDPSPESTTDVTRTTSPTPPVIEATDEVTPESTTTVMSPTPIQSPTPILTWNQLVADNFEDATSSLLLVSPTWRSITTNDGNALQAVGLAEITYTTNPLESIAIDADVQLVRGNFAVQVQANDTTYRIVLDAEGRVDVFEQNNRLAQIQDVTFVAEQWYNLRVEMLNSTVLVYLDDALLQSISPVIFEDITAVSFISRPESAVRIDNIQISTTDTANTGTNATPIPTGEIIVVATNPPPPTTMPIQPTAIPTSTSTSEATDEFIAESTALVQPELTQEPSPESTVIVEPEATAEITPELTEEATLIEEINISSSPFIAQSQISCDYSVSASDEADLVVKINTANADGVASVICLAESTFTYTSSVVTQNGYQALPIITGDMTIVGDGLGAVIERDTSATDFRLLQVDSGATLTVHNVTFQNGDAQASASTHTGYGGAIYNAGTLILNDTTFTNNNADDEGGAVYNHNNADLTVTNSTFMYNTVQVDDGGAIDNHGTVNITNSTFEYNDAVGDDGGALWNEIGSTMSITGSTIQYNTAGDRGGAIANFGTLTLTNTLVENNTAAQSAGAIYMDTGSLTITGGTLSSNIATADDGGAVQAFSTVSLDGVTINNNSAADNGGALHLHADTTIINTTLDGNTATTNGGAIWIDIYELDITDSTLNNNSAGNWGGAIMNYGTLTITNSNVDMNTATVAGGAIFSDGGTISITGGSLDANVATTGDGGAINTQSPLLLDNVTLDGNSAGDTGGAIDLSSVTVTIQNDTIFSNNTSTHDGGAIFNTSSNGRVQISDSTFTANISQHNGGALYLYAGIHTISSSLFDDNQATGRGGAIYTDSTLTIDAATIFETNSAQDDGGALYARRNLTVTNTIFRSNTASDQGGAIRSYVNNSNSSITDSCIYNNTAGSSSGIYSARANLDATMNWWGDSSGPSGDGSGTGDEVNWGVNYANFSTASMCEVAPGVRPVLTIVDAEASYTEGSPPTTLVTSATITDADSTIITSATITLTNLIDTDNEVLSVDTTSPLASTYANGLLQITGSGSFTDYAQVLQSLTYINTSQNPDPTTRVVEIVVLDDFGSSNTQQVTINITASEDPPTLTLTSANATYIEGGSPVSLLTNVVIQDIDGVNIDAGNLDGATIQLANGFDVADSISVDTTGTSIIVQSSTSSQVILSGIASFDDYEQVIASLQFTNSSSTPGTELREVAIFVTQSSLDSLTETVYVSVESLQNIPVVTLNGASTYSTSYTEGALPVSLVDTPVVITDDDSTNLESMLIYITATSSINPVSQDVLAVDTTGTSITSTYANGIMTLTGSDTLANYETVLSTLTYQNLLSDPDIQTRTITISASDGINTSEDVTVTLTVSAIESPPRINLDSTFIGANAPNFVTTYLSTDDVLDITGQVSIQDADSMQIQEATITLTGIEDGLDETLIIDDSSSSAITASPMQGGTIDLSGIASLADYAAVLSTLRYANANITPASGIRTVTISVRDVNDFYDGTDFSALWSPAVISTITVVESTPAGDVTCDEPSQSVTNWTPVTNATVDASGIYATTAGTAKATFSLEDDANNNNNEDNQGWSIVLQTNNDDPYTITTSAESGIIVDYQDGAHYVYGNEITIEWDSPTLKFIQLCYSSDSVTDLQVDHLDVNSTVVNPNDLSVSGTLDAYISNTGTTEITDNFTVIFFDDVDGDNIFDGDVDTLLAQTEVTASIEPGGALTVTAEVAGYVSFAEDLVHVYVDSDNSITEIDETNNIYWAQCTVEGVSNES